VVLWPTVPDVLSVEGSQTTLAIYDDGNDRVYFDGLSCRSTGAPVCFMRATIFQIEESTNVANLLWQYLPGYFSFWGGSIDVLSNGDVEFDSSDPFNKAASQITEVTYADSPQIVWQMMISGSNAYRGYRIPSLYPGVTWQQ
jgi:arylsulfate sulfotransferase